MRNKTKIKIALVLLLALLVSSIPFNWNLSISKASTTLKNPTITNGVTTWDCVYFGNYAQSDATGVKKEPIKWRVLSINGNDALLLADMSLDNQHYNETSTSVTWATCTLRTWLNDTFYNLAFSSNERSAIISTTLINEDNPKYNTEGGVNTTDNVYLLSLTEMSNQSYGFASDLAESSQSRWAKNTEYAKACGAYTDSTWSGNGSWWLRSMGGNSLNATDVRYDGYVNPTGTIIYLDSHIAVRPALHLNLLSNVWSYAGTVRTEGSTSGGATASPTVTKTPAPTVKPTKPKTNISLAKPDIKSLINKKEKKVMLQIKKKVSGAKEYQIAYSTSKSFKVKKVVTMTKTSITIKKLVLKKTYYFKVRAYNTLNGKMNYGSWSAVKKIKIKK